MSEFCSSFPSQSAELGFLRPQHYYQTCQTSANMRHGAIHKNKDATTVQKFGDWSFQIRDTEGVNHYCVEDEQEVTPFPSD